MPLIRERLDAGSSVRFYPLGTSMLPMLRQGQDAVVLSPLPEQLHRFDLPLYRRDNGQYVLHRIIALSDTCTCMGDNQFLPEPGIRREQMIGIVTAFTRNGREYQVTDLRYRLYCRLWHHTRPLRRAWRRIRRTLRAS